jgi:proline iminopeptidase
METTVNGVRLYYERSGPSDAPTLVGLHGGPGISDCRDQAKILGQLTDELGLLVYDARGSGRSGEDKPYGHEQWTADLDALTTQLGIQRFALLGHSYGGYIAQEFAIAYPHRLTHLILADTGSHGVDHEIPIATALASGLPGIEEGWLRESFEGRVPSNEQYREWWELLLPLYFEDGLSPEEAHERAGRVYFHYETHNHVFSDSYLSYDVRDLLPELQIPTLVICGRNDWITPLDRSELIASLIPGARLEVFEHSGHMTLLEETPKFLDLVREFIKAT